MAVYAYARASTKKQEDSPETQKDIMRRYASFNRLGDPTFFVDAAKSGKVCWEDRAAGRELFTRLQRGDTLIIPKLDRAFRRLADCVIVLEKLERMGVKLHVCNLMGGAIDLSSPMGRFLIHILAAFAELERAFISERTKDGLANKIRKGTCHTNFPGYGFKWKKVWIDGKLTKIKERDDAERAVMKAIVGWRMGDPPLSWPEISEHLRYNLKLEGKGGTTWDINRVRRACEAELRLQIQEQRANR
jgi:putative DNA-invertase from lambdoid prophage Rac